MAQWLNICLPRRPPTSVTWVRFLDSASYSMWVEFVVGSPPCSERFFSDLETLRVHLIWSLALLCVPHHHGKSN